MLIVTGFNIIGYMAAPISMGAIAPKARIFGMIVFVLLTMLLNTVEVEYSSKYSFCYSYVDLRSFKVS